MKSVAFVQDKFREYYSKGPLKDTMLTEIEKREFGFASFEGFMLRHKSFKTAEKLSNFLERSVPRDAYISCAYYEDPTTEMEKKGWLGADLTFDIDADHIPTHCTKIHDEWICQNCNLEGKGIVPEKCPACGGEKFEAYTWPCEICLASAKTETTKLLDMLSSDFGFSEKEMHVFFSGHRGYHVCVENKATNELNASARKEIADYVCGLGFDTGFSSLEKRQIGKGRFPSPPRLGDLGWRGRLAKGMYDLILHGGEEDFKSIGIERRTIETLMRNKNLILGSWDDVGPYRAVKNVGFETWRRIVEAASKSVSVSVDTVVTTDIHRLIRLVGTLHGKTGFRKVAFPAKRLDNFDPFTDAIAFKGGSEMVLVSSAPAFRLNGESFGPYRNQEVELPTAAAVLLICKGRAGVLEQNV